MFNSLKIIARILLALFCFFLLLLIIKQFLPLQYADNQSEYFFESFFFYGFPAALLLTLFFTIKQKDNFGTVFGKIILTTLIAFCSFFFMGIAALGNMCSWYTEAILFESKQSSSIKIARRSFGCGATDSGSPSYDVFKIRNITPYLIWVTKIDTNTIDKCFLSPTAK
jgi:hypothetical protein